MYIDAVIHRDYYFNGSILLSIFDDRIEINSMGGLVSTLFLYDIYNGVSESRNPNLAEIFHRLEYVENYGTGVVRIINEYNDFNLKPIIELSENIFKIILPNRNYVQKIYDNNKSQKDIIIEYIKENNKITRIEVEKILGVGNTGSKQIINKLLTEDILLKKGTGKNTYYVLK